MSAPGGDILAWLENAIRQARLPRGAMFIDLGILPRHMATIVDHGEQSHCIVDGQTFPCITIQNLAKGYGWTETQTPPVEGESMT